MDIEMTQIDHVLATPPKVQSMDYGVLCAHDEGFFPTQTLS